jgi:hypothetical protein
MSSVVLLSGGYWELALGCLALVAAGEEEEVGVEERDEKEPLELSEPLLEAAPEKEEEEEEEEAPPEWLEASAGREMTGEE